MEDADRHGGLLFSKLIGFDAEGNPKNEVADSIEVNDGNTEYTITLKKGWTFTDGTEVKAENFTRAWSYGANAANAQLGASSFTPIQGFEDLQKDGLKGDEQLSGLTVADDYTFTVKLNAPSSVFKTLLGSTELWEQANQIAPWGDDESFDIAYNADSGNKDIYEAVCNSIHNTLGIESQATPYPTFSEMRDVITDRTITTAFRSGWRPDYPLAYSYLYSLYDSESADGKGSNDGDYRNPEFDALIDKANTESSDDAAEQDYRQAQEILFKDLPSVPLWYANSKGVAAKNVKGFALTWQGIEDYRNMTKE
ncbi:ABC transporter substrate-binding protein [uncultured Bifidobacterium sp.]|uniref:peptide ABC transporter substrate-binding protein n=2 Tax=uncultured Bifidobacterium sp. TaxID=165187 RepID=UPI0027DAE079|nr:ABC transporter substrate-binding protein [uncultured Bifidobacterium sp.]